MLAEAGATGAGLVCFLALVFPGEMEEKVVLLLPLPFLSVVLSSGARAVRSLLTG